MGTSRPEDETCRGQGPVAATQAAVDEAALPQRVPVEQDGVCVSGWVCCVSCSDRGQGLARIQDQDPDPGDAGTWSEPRVDTESPLLAST